jgi:hypothetical protein
VALSLTKETEYLRNENSSKNEKMGNDILPKRKLINPKALIDG